MTGLLVDLMALLLDLANIVGGFLLAASLATGSRVGGDVIARAAGVAGRAAPVVGIVALVAGGYWFLVHATSGPHLFHFELVGIGVGVALLWDRLTGRPSALDGRSPTPSGAGLILAVVGLIAVVVGIQGLITPNG